MMGRRGRLPVRAQRESRKRGPDCLNRVRPSDAGMGLIVLQVIDINYTNLVPISSQLQFSYIRVNSLVAIYLYIDTLANQEVYLHRQVQFVQKVVLVRHVFPQQILGMPRRFYILSSTIPYILCRSLRTQFPYFQGSPLSRIYPRTARTFLFSVYALGIAPLLVPKA